MPTYEDLNRIERRLLTANCAEISAIVVEARKEGFISCACGAFKISTDSPCHRCGRGTTPLGANLAGESIGLPTVPEGSSH